jgi:flagellin
MVIQHNLSAMNSNRQLGITTGLTAKSSEKLSSGYKINRAADDAAGLAISEKMRRQIRGLAQGINNVQDGISMLQIGDGALEEVMDMVHRMTTLAVQSSNDTLTDDDRSYIQEEVNALCSEIERVDEVTEFNNIKIFGNGEESINNADGTPLIEGDIPFSSYSFADVSIDSSPVFSSGSHGDQLGLKAIVSDANSAAKGKAYRLIFGDGSTSNSSVRLNYQKDGETVTEIASLRSDFTISDYTNNNGTVSRTYTYNKNGIEFSIVQTATPNSTDKYYGINYEINNTGSTPLDLEFMFHADTAYNNNDTCESYYTEGARIETTRIYKSSGYGGAPSGTNVIEGVPGGVSIINKDEALAFAENVSFDTSPDMLSIGPYSAIRNWPYYDSTASLGTSTNKMDLGFSAVWEKKNMASGDTLSVSFKFGITETENDPNLKQDEIKKSDKPAVVVTEAKQFWIQASSTIEDGMYISFGSIDLESMHLTQLDVSKSTEARKSIERLKQAQKHVSELRSRIGAQQNRLEHTAKNQANNLENTQAAESRIRDTDMAEEMVRYSNNNILAQAGQAMLAQANQTNQGVMALLQ